jgi:hypothetical protein
MTKIEKVKLLNATIANERNGYARKVGAEAYLVGGRLFYRDCRPGYARRITLTELLSHLHGADIRALRAVL